MLKYIVKDAGQIPVTRMTEGRGQRVRRRGGGCPQGRVIGVYPEGTITKDPDGWPMRGKTGAARIALATGCPVIPVGQWGAQEILPAVHRAAARVPAQDAAYKVGDPVDLDDLRDQPLTPEVLREATDRIMAAITALVEDLRGEQAPAVRFDPKTSGVVEIGNPNRKKKRGHAMTKVAVFGAGSWGTAFSIVLADAGNDVTIWGRRPEVLRDAINERHENTEYFPGIELPPSVARHAPTRTRPPTAPSSSCSPSRRRRCGTTWGSGRARSRTTSAFVSLMKGVELGTTKRMSEVIAEVTGAGPERIAVVSGPNLAREIALREPAA